MEVVGPGVVLLPLAKSHEEPAIDAREMILLYIVGHGYKVCKKAALSAVYRTTREGCMLFDLHEGYVHLPVEYNWVCTAADIDDEVDLDRKVHPGGCKSLASGTIAGHGHGLKKSTRAALFPVHEHEWTRSMLLVSFVYLIEWHAKEDSLL